MYNQINHNLHPVANQPQLIYPSKPLKHQEIQQSEDLSTQNSPVSFEHQETPINENNVEKFLNLGVNQDYMYINGMYNQNPQGYNLPSCGSVQGYQQFNNFLANNNNNSQGQIYQNNINPQQIFNANMNGHEFQVYSGKYKNLGGEMYDGFLNSAQIYQKDDLFLDENDFLAPVVGNNQHKLNQEQQKFEEQHKLLIEMQVQEQLKNINSNDQEEIKFQFGILLEQNKDQQISKSQINKLIEKSKRIVKRDKAKNRSKVLTELGKNQILSSQMKGQSSKLIEITPMQSSLTATIQTQKKSIDQSQLMSQIPHFDLEQQSLQIDQVDDLLHNSFSSNDNLQNKFEINQQLFENSSVKFEDNQSTSDSTLNQANNNNQNELPQKVQKKIQQMIRNRISAQNSRDRKKAYIQKLESDNEKLLKQNQQLNSKVQYLETQNKQLQVELQKQKRVIQQNTDQYSYNINNMGSEMERPQRSNNNNMFNTNYYKFGLALLSIVSIICLINLNKDSTYMDSHNRVLTQVPAQSQAMEIEGSTPSLLQIEDNSQANKPIISQYYQNFQYNKDKDSLNQDLHMLLKHIDTYRNNLMKQIQSLSVIKEEEDNSKSLATISQSQELQQLNIIQENNQLAMIKQQDLSTMYCPNLYLHSNNNSNQIGPQQQIGIQNSDWIQLLVPKNQITSLQIQEESIDQNDANNGVKATKSLRSYFKNQTNTKQINILKGSKDSDEANNSNNSLMVELLCKVHKYRELQ